jgi:hypothetical protein
MKKTTFFVVFASLLMSSCLKDGFNDFDALNHDLVFHGVVNPTLGVPIGQGSATVFDMLNMVQLSTASMEIGNDSVMTLTYDTILNTQIDLSNSSKSRHGSKSDVVYVSRNSIEGAVAIDLFDNITLLDEADLEVDSLLVYLKAHLKASTEDSIRTINALQHFHVQVYYDQLRISVLGKDDNLYNILSLDDSIPVVDILQGEDIILFNNVDISNMINKRPKEIRYSARMNIAFESEFFAVLGISEDEFVADSIGVNLVDITADLKARFPISAYFNNIQYETDIDFTHSVHLDDLSIDSSMLYLECENGIPMALDIRASFIDNNNNEICVVLDSTIHGAVVNQVNNRYIATQPFVTVLGIPVDKTVYEALLNTTKIRLKAGLSTADVSSHHRVAIRANDKINLKVYAKLKPTYTLDYELGGNNDSEGGDQ